MSTVEVQHAAFSFLGRSFVNKLIKPSPKLLPVDAVDLRAKRGFRDHAQLCLDLLKRHGLDHSFRKLPDVEEHGRAHQEKAGTGSSSSSGQAFRVMALPPRSRARMAVRIRSSAANKNLIMVSRGQAAIGCDQSATGMSARFGRIAATMPASQASKLAARITNSVSSPSATACSSRVAIHLKIAELMIQPHSISESRPTGVFMLTAAPLPSTILRAAAMAAAVARRPHSSSRSVSLPIAVARSWPAWTPVLRLHSPEQPSLWLAGGRLPARRGASPSGPG